MTEPVDCVLLVSNQKSHRNHKTTAAGVDLTKQDHSRGTGWWYVPTNHIPFFENKRMVCWAEPCRHRYIFLFVTIKSLFFRCSLVCVCENGPFAWGKALTFRAFRENCGWCFSSLIYWIARAPGTWKTGLPLRSVISIFYSTANLHKCYKKF